MRKQKYVEINGITFELTGTKTFMVFDSERAQGIENELSDFYNRCSVYKERAWDDIKAWCREMPICGVRIRSANSNFFVVDGFCEWQGVKYYVVFTGRHNRAYVCLGEV